MSENIEKSSKPDETLSPEKDVSNDSLELNSSNQTEKDSKITIDK